MQEIVFAWMAGISSPALDVIVYAVSESYLVLLFLAPFLLVHVHTSLSWAALRDRDMVRKMLALFGAMVFSFALATALKIITDVPRPCAALQNVHAPFCSASMSFPSRHTALAFTPPLFFLTRKKWLAVFFVWAALIAVSRIYLGQHYPTDVIAGAILGLSVGYTSRKLGCA